MNRQSSFEICANDTREFAGSGASQVGGARLKDEFGGVFVRVRGHSKIMAHLMFGILALTADQLMRFVT